MSGSSRELARFELRSKVASSLLVFSITCITFSIILSLVIKDPLTLGLHLYLFVVGILLGFSSLIIHEDEMYFASQFDMTHLLDIDDKDLRFQAYLQHLSEWIAPGIEEINPIRTRGGDPNGPDWGKTDFKLGHDPTRRDAVSEDEKYEGMEGELTSGEQMVAKANEEYSQLAQKRWEHAESNDPDLVEYGVERLGDLVNTDYFDKNAEDGAFSKVANPDEESR